MIDLDGNRSSPSANGRHPDGNNNGNGRAERVPERLADSEYRFPASSEDLRLGQISIRTCACLCDRSR